MATYYSTLAANRFTTTPPARANSSDLGQAYRAGTTFTLTTDHDAADIIALFPIPSGMTVRQVLFSTDGAATAGNVDIGLYTADDAGVLTAVDADVFASAQAVTSALTMSDVTGEAGTITLDERYIPIWDAATALTTNPNVTYWVCYTVTTDVDATTVTAVDVVGLI